MAEETDNPRRNVPRAVFASIILMAASYVLFSYVTVEGFGQNVESLGKTEIPSSASPTTPCTRSPSSPTWPG